MDASAEPAFKQPMSPDGPLAGAPDAPGPHGDPPTTASAGRGSGGCGDPLTVLYDGSCPLCRREIGLYQVLAAQTPASQLKFIDVSTPATLAAAEHPPAATPAQLMERFHVQHADGGLDSGARAFVALWARLPGWRWLARVARVPGITPVLELGYRGFLPLRPWLQRVARAFEPAALHVPAALRGDLRSDHAGETGAVWMYRGVLAVARDPGLRAFARRHGATEQTHLDLIAACLPWPQRSRLLPAWRLAGFLTGVLPALVGPRAVYATIAAVETFVDRHYQQQIDRIDAAPAAGRAAAAPLRDLLRRCQADEQHHRDEAVALQAPASGRLLRAWCALVGRGSAVAVALARRF
jgi:ubiquinone biosynthesis monooxygenase Coq7